MAAVSTVRGGVDSAGLGVTLIHEHICFRFVGMRQTGGPFLDEAFRFDLELLRKARAVGINTVVDLTPWPNVGELVELNALLPEMHFVLSTGAYIDGMGPEEIRALSEAEMEEHMALNITDGYEGFESTGVKAGIIKVGSRDQNITEWEKKNFRAAARVQQRLRVPIAVHSVAGARNQMEVLRAAGADISGTFYSHVEAEFGWEGRSLQEEARYLEEIAREGGHLQFNNFDFEFDTPFPDMLYLINHLEERGYGDRIFISIDVNIEVDDQGKIWLEAERQHPEAGRRTYAYMITHAVPMLMSGGVSLQRISRYLIDNPRRFFEALHGS
jgi:phosphotriesterase-related protein